MLRKKALLAALGVAMSVTLVTVGTAATASAQTPTARSAPVRAELLGTLVWSDCMYYYGDYSYCCWYALFPNINVCARYVPSWYLT